jgi:hypothetical protein
LRDARIAPIYEGTNGIQAIDLVTRKLPLSGGAAVRAYLDELRSTVAAVKVANHPSFAATGQRLGEAVDNLDRATGWLLGKLDAAPDAALAGATPYLRLFGLTAGGCMLAKEALAATRAADDNGAAASLTATAHFFATNLTTAASGLASNVIDGAEALDTITAQALT